ncbi:hypothetical protein CLAFUW4_03897 [Fulvia fulva]|uniref:Uncharacterized protein n=1 Tax=Passalora fulva TaxID=5499 RepID=A0A9Q8LBH6_PASFU|nr:uncharacterized protein CLAFUR5_03867 [Fulvia fulva]KAK4631408.1 hypothetical protein CLAFUR4_03885 [Fulvia fulva]KAK4632869.1 hypothetical protein CLAFUR0_03884 [Fulvia fulva]UJO14377.1 hypothetical protein CLAFUR5_03867 [Fulvia fulva]WPV11859.1 hypothetical protein CLAFUW4_03897 [Fulvia fulva]WPV25732.1 hypothetical protein CLAFUW7_03888 [Fulvia fulva]
MLSPSQTDMLLEYKMRNPTTQSVGTLDQDRKVPDKDRNTPNEEFNAPGKDFNAVSNDGMTTLEIKHQILGEHSYRLHSPAGETNSIPPVANATSLWPMLQGIHLDNNKPRPTLDVVTLNKGLRVHCRRLL